MVALQREWAARNGFALNREATALIDSANALFGGRLSEDTRNEMAAGAGGELARLGSLRSSSCLALNVFAPWRPAPGRLGDLFETPVDALAFEVKQPTGLRGAPPHLDVVLSGAGVPVAIESKFIEMYAEATNSFRPAYFAHPGLWDGMEKCRELAGKLQSGSEVYRWLSAAQLLKHTLGLQRNQPSGFRLVLVWYRVDGSTSDSIDEEIARYAAWVGDEVDFAATTYQQLVSHLAKGPEPEPGYFDYLADRYRLG